MLQTRSACLKGEGERRRQADIATSNIDNLLFLSQFCFCCSHYAVVLDDADYLCDIHLTENSAVRLVLAVRL